MTLRVWRARIESVAFGKDDARQVTAMFSTEQEALALSAALTTFARSQAVLVAPFSNEHQARINALNAGERAISPTNDAGAAARADRNFKRALHPSALRRTGLMVSACLPSTGLACQTRPPEPACRAQWNLQWDLLTPTESALPTPDLTPGTHPPRSPTRIARQTVFHGGSHPSALTLEVFEDSRER